MNENILVCTFHLPKAKGLLRYLICNFCIVRKSKIYCHKELALSFLFFLLSISFLCCHNKGPHGLNNKNLFSYTYVGCNSIIKISPGLLSSEASLLGLQMAVFMFTQYSPSICLHVQMSSYKYTSHIGPTGYTNDLVLG